MGYDIALINLADENTGSVPTSSHVDEKLQTAPSVMNILYVTFQEDLKAINISQPRSLGNKCTRFRGVSNAEFSLRTPMVFDHWFRLRAVQRASIYLLIVICVQPVMTILLAIFYFCSWLVFIFALECALIGQRKHIHVFIASYRLLCFPFFFYLVWLIAGTVLNIQYCNEQVWKHLKAFLKEKQFVLVLLFILKMYAFYCGALMHTHKGTCYCALC